MKNDGDGLASYFDKRFDAIEELLRISVAQSVIQELSPELCSPAGGTKGKDLPSELADFLEKRNLICQKSFAFGPCTAILVQGKDRLSFNSVQTFERGIHLRFPDIIPVFSFDQGNRTLRRKLREYKISYYIEGEELMILRYPHYPAII